MILQLDLRPPHEDLVARARALGDAHEEGCALMAHLDLVAREAALRNDDLHFFGRLDVNREEHARVTILGHAHGEV